MNIHGERKNKVTHYSRGADMGGCALIRNPPPPIAKLLWNLEEHSKKAEKLFNGSDQLYPKR